jgi:exoribonuclease-2
MNTNTRRHRAILQDLAHRAMQDRGLLPDFSRQALAEMDWLQPVAPSRDDSIRDLRALPWASIDNDDSRDLDQLTVAEALPQGRVRIMVAVADVDALVKVGFAIDEQAHHNTTSVYTAGGIFPMLPERLSTDLTSLNLDEDRLAVVVDMVIDDKGHLDRSDIYRAWVRNHARLAYNGVAAWLEGEGAELGEISEVQGLGDSLRLQDAAAQGMRDLRRANGALTLQTIEARPVFEGDDIRELQEERPNRATELIEDFMIAANGVTARFLAAKGFPSIRRVVRAPRRWERIVELAAERGHRLPSAPDSVALDEFLVSQRADDPQTFPDLSLAVIKLLGSGEYLAQAPEASSPGHFGLAVKDYTHSTAPNRRYTDLITQRLLKAAIAGQPWPYSNKELIALAKSCTQKEDTANKVERQVAKSAAALLLEGRIGQEFDAIVTGAADKGTWVRLLSVPVEGRLVRGFEGADVGDHMRVQLIDTNVERGFIDLARVTPPRRR